MNITQQVTEKAKGMTPDQIKQIIGSLKGIVVCKGPGWKVAQQRLDVWESILNLSGDKPIAPKQPDPIEVQVAQKYINIYNNAKRRNKEFNLSYSDIRRLLTRKTCAYTGVPLTQNNGVPQFTDRTIDRFDPSQGYIKGNVYAVSHGANQIKNELLEKTSSALFTDIKTLSKLVNTIQSMGFENLDINELQDNDGGDV